MEHGLVTVVVCVYNAGEFLRSSIVSILGQSYRKLEILIIDDGSTDGCISTIRDLFDPRIKILRQENQGKPAALNHALAQMNGEFYAVHDGDDLSHPLRIEKQVQCMRSHPSVAAVFCGHDLILNGRRVAPRCAPKDEARCRKDIEMMRMPGHDPTAMYRVSMVKEFTYDQALPIVEGYDYVMRVGEQVPMRVLGACLYSYRIHWNTVTRRDPNARRRLAHTAKRRIYERRGLPYDDSTLGEILPQVRPKNRELDNDIVSHFMESVVDLRRASQWKNAASAAITCFMLHPTDLYYYKPLVYVVAPLAFIDWYRTMKADLS